MFKLDLNDTFNDKNIQALAKDTELQYDMKLLSTKLDCLMKKVEIIVKQQGEKCNSRSIETENEFSFKVLLFHHGLAC